jgi:hypothetical protein
MELVAVAVPAVLAWQELQQLEGTVALAPLLQLQALLLPERVAVVAAHLAVALLALGLAAAATEQTQVLPLGLAQRIQVVAAAELAVQLVGQIPAVLAAPVSSSLEFQTTSSPPSQAA